MSPQDPCCQIRHQRQEAANQRSETGGREPWVPGGWRTVFLSLALTSRRSSSRGRWQGMGGMWVELGRREKGRSCPRTESAVEWAGLASGNESSWDRAQSRLDSDRERRWLLRRKCLVFRRSGSGEQGDSQFIPWRALCVGGGIPQDSWLESIGVRSSDKSYFDHDCVIRNGHVNRPASCGRSLTRHNHVHEGRCRLGALIPSISLDRFSEPVPSVVARPNLA